MYIYWIFFFLMSDFCSSWSLLLSPIETNCMKCQSLFFGKISKILQTVVCCMLSIKRKFERFDWLNHNNIFADSHCIPSEQCLSFCQRHVGLGSSVGWWTGDQEVMGSIPIRPSNILSWRLIKKYFLLSFSPFLWFKKGSC